MNTPTLRHHRCHRDRDRDRMAAPATRIADGELQRDVDPPTGSLETAEPAGALDMMLANLRSAIEDRERAARASDEARDAMRRFLADVSHELRTPLTALKGYSDLYAGGMLADPDALDRAMARVGDESERLNGFVTDMLQLAREAPAVEATERFDAAEVVAVVGHPARFHQAILNVVSNACQHTAANTSVRIATRRTADALVIEVIDHGEGVDSAEAHKIFLPFYRSETSRNRDGRGGAGLGLTIAGQIIERLNGSITVASTPGGGATFVITVPLAEVIDQRDLRPPE